MKTILVALGTRPEAIKLAPLVLELRQLGDCKTILGVTGQHPQMADDALAVFGLAADVKLDCVPPGGNLCVTAASVIEATGGLLDECRPDAVVVQGDTTSAWATGMAAALRQVPVAHVEAGLRSGKLDDPFPEELMRIQISHLARWNFAPTVRAVENLRHEGIADDSIHLMGNTVIDALRMVRAQMPMQLESDKKTILVTVHRRENWGERLQTICESIAHLASQHDDWQFVFSVHPNPTVRKTVEVVLSGVETVSLLAAPRYDEWVAQIVNCDLILTDSGGIQEEGCALGRPTLVLRDTTERPEAVESGSAILVGADRQRIIGHVEQIMGDPAIYARMAQARTVFGDGFAAERIAKSLSESLTLDRDTQRVHAQGVATS